MQNKTIKVPRGGREKAYIILDGIKQQNQNTESGQRKMEVKGL